MTTTIKHNVNPKMNPISTIFGILIFIVTTLYIFIPMFYLSKDIEYNYETNIWIIGGGYTWSFLSIIAPDDFKSLLKGTVKKL